VRNVVLAPRAQGCLQRKLFYITAASGGVGAAVWLIFHTSNRIIHTTFRWFYRWDFLMPIVKFKNEKKEIEVPAGSNLRKEAIKAGINVYQGVNGIGATVNKYANCMGLGVCGTCRVLVKQGMENCNPMTTVENVKLAWIPVPDPVNMSYIGNENEMRLACCVEVNGDIEVETGPDVNLFGENFFS